MDRRVRTGCATCRRRRVKCDETKPICNRCRTANFHCEGYAAPRRAANAISASASSASSSRSPEKMVSISELEYRHKDWRQEQLPLYHHFVTTTVVRLFRIDHVSFWRDQVAQMSFGMDLVYEALLAIGAVHRGSLIACQEGNGPEAARFKVLALRSYGKTISLLPSHLSQNNVPEILANLVVLMLLAYFECFMENPKGTFRHLWAAIELLRSIEGRLSDREVSNMVPIFDAMLRLDFMAQKLVPYASSSFLRFSDNAFLESPFWNRPLLEYSNLSHSDHVASERYRLIQLVCAHNKLSRVVWGNCCPTSECPTRDELMGFYAEMKLWKATSPATFANCEGLDDIGAPNATALPSLPMPPPPFFCSSNEAALNISMYNSYLGCAVSMINTTDPDPAARELEAFNLVYQNLCIAEGLVERHAERNEIQYKPCDAISIGITTTVYYGLRRSFSPAWQTWTIAALRKIGREGLSNGFTLANTLEIMCQLEAKLRPIKFEQSDDDEENSYLGPISERPFPLLVPRGEEDQFLAFYLRYESSGVGADRGAVEIVARAIWTQDGAGAMDSLKLDLYDSALDENANPFDRPQAGQLFSSWRQAVEKGWHGYLSKEIQDGFLQREASPNG